MGYIGDMFSSKKGVGFTGTRSEPMETVKEHQLEDVYHLNRREITSTRDFLNALAAQGGIQNQGQVFAQQQALANQLQAQANGEGPNPALAQLANTTGQNVAQQAALMGSQRGAGANAGLMARQAAMQGGAIQQQSAGQAAVLRAQQQLAAQQALQQQQAMMGQLSTQQISQQAQARNMMNQYALGLYGTQQNAAAAFNNAQVGMQSNLNNVNASIAQLNAQGQQAMFGGLLSGLSASGGSMGGGGGGGMGSMMGGGGGGGAAEGGGEAAGAAAARGGMVPKKYADGGEVDGFSLPQLGSQFESKGPFLMSQSPAPSYSLGTNTDLSTEPNSFTAKILKSLDQRKDEKPQNVDQSNPYSNQNPGSAALYKGAKDQGTLIRKMFTMGFGGASGGQVPGKAGVKGNSLKNDNVPAMLSPGEIVIPRSIAQSENAPDKAKAFVEAVLARHGMRK